MTHNPFAAAAGIVWPNKFRPEVADIFVSNEVIIKDSTMQRLWTLLVDQRKWPMEYMEVSPRHELLSKGSQFTMEFLNDTHKLDCTVVEAAGPTTGNDARLAWRGESKAAGGKLTTYYAWLLQNVRQGSVRLLFRQTMQGSPASNMSPEESQAIKHRTDRWLDSLAANVQDR